MTNENEKEKNIYQFKNPQHLRLEKLDCAFPQPKGQQLKPKFNYHTLY
jgi:hypothetical protein